MDPRSYWLVKVTQGLVWLWTYFVLSGLNVPAAAIDRGLSTKPGTVYVVPIRENIMPPLVYVVRRGVKQAMEAKADVLILDMKTDGGRVDVTEEIIRIVSKFPGLTVTYINDRAFSAGAFISVATQKIYMAPQSVIGAAAPIMVSPFGTGAEKLPDTLEAKMTSAVAALIRVQAEKNGHNVEVVEAMIDKTKELKIDGEILNPAGNILTLTDRQAAKKYGDPPKPLMSLGTVDSMNDLLDVLGYSGATLVEIQPTGVEKIGTWINAFGPMLLIIGMVGLYLEFKTPGFGLPGVIGIAAFALYFFGGHVAGLSGAGWGLVFVLGLILVSLELFVFTGTLFLGLTGIVLMLVALVMGMVDMYPGGPTLPTFPQLRVPLRDLAISLFGTIAIALILARFLPQTSLFQKLISQSASGVSSVAAQEAQQQGRVGQVGVAISELYPGGKARFDDVILDVVTQGDFVDKGQSVRIISYTGATAVVELVH